MRETEGVSAHPVRELPASLESEDVRHRSDSRASAAVLLLSDGACPCPALSSIDGWQCPRCRRATTAFSSPSFLTFPDHLLIVVRRFLFDSWVPSKLDAQVKLQPSIDLEDWRGQGLQPGEEELPADSGASASASAAPVPNAAIVDQLEGMGFSKNAASRAVS